MWCLSTSDLKRETSPIQNSSPRQRRARTAVDSLPLRHLDTLRDRVQVKNGRRLLVCSPYSVFETMYLLPPPALFSTPSAYPASSKRDAYFCQPFTLANMPLVRYRHSELTPQDVHAQDWPQLHELGPVHPQVEPQLQAILIDLVDWCSVAQRSSSWTDFDCCLDLFWRDEESGIPAGRNWLKYTAVVANMIMTRL